MTTPVTSNVTVFPSLAAFRSSAIAAALPGGLVWIASGTGGPQGGSGGQGFYYVDPAFPAGGTLSTVADNSQNCIIDQSSIRWFSANNMGVSTLNFGAIPGASDASVNVTGQVGIAATSVINVWVQPALTADHSADEHWVDPPIVTGGNIVAGVGFTIYGLAPTKEYINKAELSQLFNQVTTGATSGTLTVPNAPVAGQWLYGAYQIGWQWR